MTATNHKSELSTVGESADYEESLSLVERIIEQSREHGSQPTEQREMISGLMTAADCGVSGNAPATSDGDIGRASIFNGYCCDR